jgi:hypothetical protein
MRYLESPIGSQRNENMTPINQEPETAATEETTRTPRWELAECTCPDWCERDHEQD